ncbi:MAG: HEAT repeat domain-containing protein [Tannerella sp.]|jgi:HEAT repeat protein|nr:HEAT repeat domain-containing protein [Tannerella sp.]
MNVSELIKILSTSPDWEARRDAAKELGKRKEAVAFDALVNALRNDHKFPVRFRAAEALGALGLPKAAPALLEAIGPNGDKNNTVVEDAAIALGTMQLVETVEPMLAALRERCKSYREGQDYTAIRGISEGLGKMGSVAVPPLLECLKRKEMVNEMLIALEPTGDPRAEEALLAVASDESLPAYVRKTAVHGLGNISGATCGKMLSNLLAKASDDGFISAINQSLKKMGYEVNASDTEAAKQRAAKKLLSGLRAIRPGMTEEEADGLVGGAVFGMGANQVHRTPFGEFQLLVHNGIVTGTWMIEPVIEKIEEFLKSDSDVNEKTFASKLKTFFKKFCKTNNK